MTATGDGASETRRELLRRAYAAYNAQDLDALANLVSDNVDWPDGRGGRLYGRDEVRAYWMEQWTCTRTHDEPIGFDDVDDGRIAVRVDQAVRALDGSVISTGKFAHLHRVEGDLIWRLDIEPALGGGGASRGG